MDILKSYRNFLNESVDHFKEVKSVNDIPNEVIETAKKIANQIFDRVKKPFFDINEDGIIMTFNINDQDFIYIDKNEILTLDLNDGSKKKRNYNVVLKYFDSISETYEVKYIVEFQPNNMNDDDDNFVDDDNDNDDELEDLYYKTDPDDYIDEDEIDHNIKSKIKINDNDLYDVYYDDDEY